MSKRCAPNNQWNMAFQVVEEKMELFFTINIFEKIKTYTNHKAKDKF